jgi:L-iditol 2-dehydrogenase
MSSMNAHVLHAVGDMRFETLPCPEPGAGHVLVRVAFCGVCGSDIPRVFVTGTYHFPTVIGHEFSGRVEACGPGVTDLEPGDRVVVFPLIWCGKCPPCEQGKYVQCLDYDYLGSRSDGGFGQFVVAPRRNLVRVPEGVSLAEAAMTEPAAVALHALRRACNVSAGRSVAIFGAGPVGLMVAQWARAMGAGPICLFDIISQKLDMARRMGFDLAFDSRSVDPVQTVQSATGRDGAHVCVEAAGVPPTFVQAASATMRGGRMVMLGNPSADVTMPSRVISQLMRREVTLVGTWNSDFSVAGNDDWQTVLAGMADRTVNFEPLITHRVRLKDAFDALQMMRGGGEFFSKVLIQVDEGAT